MFDKSDDRTTSVLPSLTKLQSQQPQSSQSSTSKQYLKSTSLDQFISSSHTRSQENGVHIQDKPLNSSQLITIPTTPVRRRRHRNDVLPSSKKRNNTKNNNNNNKSSQRTINRSQSSQDPLTLSIPADYNSSSRKATKSNKPRQELLPSPVKLLGIKLGSPNVNKFELSKEKLFKYRQWFMSIDADDSGSLDRNELLDSFVASGVVASEKICSKLFELMDVDGSGEVDFDNFIRTITSSSMSKAVQMHKLDAMITNQSALSTETLLSQERRKILMKFVVDKDKLHDFEMDSLTTDDQKASKKLAKLHQPMNESKNRPKPSKSSAFTTNEIDLIAESMAKKKTMIELTRTLSVGDPDNLPRANMERRRTRMTGEDLMSMGSDDANDDIDETENKPRGNLANGIEIFQKSRGIANFQRLSHFNIAEMIKKKKEQEAENKKKAEVQDVLCNVIASEKKKLIKRMSQSDDDNISSHKGLSPLNEVLPAEVMKMMDKQDDGLYKFNQPRSLQISVVEEDDEDSNDDDDDDDGEEECGKEDEIEDESVSASASVSASVSESNNSKKNNKVSISPISIKVRKRRSPKKPTITKKLGYLSDDATRNGSSMVLRPIGCHYH